MGTGRRQKPLKLTEPPLRSRVTGVTTAALSR